ncbi:MAG: hypothetical protein KDB03_24910 [Planctomycetales bacterium]|nr:hypothetical protein [Planctomycetales bacterium]
MLLKPENTQFLMLLTGIGIMCWLFFRGKMLRGRALRSQQQLSQSLRHNGNVNSKPIVFRGTESLGAPPEVLRWQLELSDLARQLKGELDSKMLAVQSITRAYNQAAVRLSELIRQAESVRMDAATKQSSVSNDVALVKAHELAAAGWSVEKIATSIGYSLDDVRLLLRQSNGPQSESRSS